MQRKRKTHDIYSSKNVLPVVGLYCCVVIFIHDTAIKRILELDPSSRYIAVICVVLQFITT